MIVKKLPLSDIKKPEKNVRIHSAKQIAEFRRSVEKFDQIRPIVVDENHVIIAGNGLYETLLTMGRTEADCYIIEGLSDKDKKKLMLADNKIFSLGVDDMAVFEEFVNDMCGDYDIPGYESELLETLASDARDIDELMSGYGKVSESTKEQIESTAKKYVENDVEYSKTAEEVRPAESVPNTVPDTPEQPSHESSAPIVKIEEPEKLQRRFVVCPKCGERIWI